MSPVVSILISLATLIIGALLGFTYRKNVSEAKIGRSEEYAKELLEDATRKAEEKKKETILAAKEEVLRLKTDLDKEIHDRRAEQQRNERRVAQREETLDKKLDNLEKREERMNQKAKRSNCALMKPLNCETNRQANWSASPVSPPTKRHKSLSAAFRRKLTTMLPPQCAKSNKKPRMKATKKPATSLRWPFKGAPATTWRKQRYRS